MERIPGAISVVMPAYNCERHIGEALASALAQTLPPLEILVLDDGSSDGTAAVVDSFCRRDSRVRLYTGEKNQGVAAVRNRGVALARGEWIAFLDSDDQWTADKLEKQAAFLTEKQADFCFTGSSFVDESGATYSGMLEVPETVTREQLLRQNVISCSSVMIRRELMARYPMKPGKIHEDFDAWLRILEEVPAAYGLNEPLLIYRISRSSRSGNKLRSFHMNYKTYRSAGLNPLQTAANLYWYTRNGLKKYKNIKK